MGWGAGGQIFAALKTSRRNGGGSRAKQVVRTSPQVWMTKKNIAKAAYGGHWNHAQSRSRLPVKYSLVLMDVPVVSQEMLDSRGELS